MPVAVRIGLGNKSPGVILEGDPPSNQRPHSSDSHVAPMQQHCISATCGPGLRPHLDSL